VRCHSAGPFSPSCSCVRAPLQDIKCYAGESGRSNRFLASQPCW
jgi:hypothetical protein